MRLSLNIAEIIPNQGNMLKKQDAEDLNTELKFGKIKSRGQP